MNKKLSEKPALEYVHKPSIGNYDMIKEISNQVGKILESFYYDKKIAGLDYLIIRDQEKIDRNYILKDLSKATENTFPFIYLAVQHFDLENREITEFVKKHDFVEVF